MILTPPRFPPLRSTEQFGATATPPTGQTIVSIAFQYSPGGANQWTTFDTESVSPYTGTLDTTTLANGVYDFRAVATYETAGGVETSDDSPVVPDLAVANNATYVALANTGSPLTGNNVGLTATPEAGGAFPDTVTFEACPTSADCPGDPTSAQWKTIATVGPQLDDSGNPTGNFVTTFDTTTLADGTYDLSVTATDAISNPNSPDQFVGGVVGHLLIDNTPPTVTLSSPGVSLSGVATLTASAQDAGSGVDAVKFQVAPAGTGNWTTIGVTGGPPYSVSFDTRQLADGSYDVRADAADYAGNAATSTVPGVTIANPGAQPFPGLTITNYAAPASNIKLLGELPGTQHETWAIGQTEAPAPTVNGTPLPYTAQGNGQIVLLQYTESTSWRIVDVLRCAGGAGACQGVPDGNAFPLLAGASMTFGGAMTASGEAWITLAENPHGGSGTLAVFHRLPGGPFEYDPAAATTLTPLLQGTPTMRLGQAADGKVYGMLVPTSPPLTTQTVPSPSGPVSVSVGLEYGQLGEDGQWTTQGSSLPADYVAPSGVNQLKLDAADVTGPGTGWAAIEQDGLGVWHPLLLARFDQNGWSFQPQTGLDALDLTGPFDPNSPQWVAAGPPSTLQANALTADSGGVWVSATVSAGTVIARFDPSGNLLQSWCTGLPRQSLGCGASLDVDHPAAVPGAVFSTSEGLEADALASGALDVYYHGAWTSVGAPGLGPARGASAFADPTDGWLTGVNTLARVSAAPIQGQLTSWPEANRNPLLSVALPPGQSTTDTPGALAVGLNGTAVHYDPSAGWQVDATPPQTHHIELTGVAFAGSSLAFAVGQEGTILRWDGTSWAEDPQSVKVTTATLNAVAFGADGEGWAVGGFGTILHYDGSTWSAEQIDSDDSGADVTSVAVAGQDVYAIAAGKLLMRTPNGVWQRVPAASLPSPAPATGSLELVSGLPDGGVAVAGKSLLMARQSPSADFAYSPQSFSGILVGLAAFRDPNSGEVRAFVSVAPPIDTISGATNTVGGFPAGDGDLLLQTDGGWQDLSRDLPPGSTYSAPGDGVVQPDPVLAVAASPDGSHAWAVGGYAGTHAADGIGTDQPLSARPTDWFTASIWRYDVGGSASSPATAQATVSLPASQSTVSFAFFSSPMCKVECAAVQHAQPDVNLSAAAAQIASFARQPGGPAFAMLGGNAVGPIDQGAYQEGMGAVDLAHLRRCSRRCPALCRRTRPTVRSTRCRRALTRRSVGAGVRQLAGPVRAGRGPGGIAPRAPGTPTGRSTATTPSTSRRTAAPCA